MKKLITLGMLFFMPVLSAGQYVGVNLGMNNGVLTNQSHNDKVRFKLGGNYVRKFDSNFHAEAEINYRENHQKADKSSENGAVAKKSTEKYSLTYMANVLYDVQNLQTYGIVPYFGVGIGYAQNTEKSKVKGVAATKQDKVRDNRLAYQGIVGVKMPINETLSVGAEYHYHAGKAHTKDHSLAMTVVRSF